MLSEDFAAGEMFFFDAPAALAETRSGKIPTGEFGRLVDFLTRQLAGTAAARIRRANVLDLIDETLARCTARYEPALAPLAPLEQAVREQRAKLGAQLVDFPAHFALFERALNVDKQLISAERFRNVVKCPGTHRLDGAFDGAEGGDQ